MTTITKTTETKNANIAITLTRKVSDKVNFSDGYEIVTGREVYENYEVTITGKDGKSIKASGKPGGAFFFELAGKYNKLPAGAVARIGNGYVGQGTYDICMAMIADLDAEVTKPDEQIALEAEQVKAPIAIETEPEHGQNGYCRKCHSYCYGDCQVK